MRVLITGASGFIGSRILAELLARNHDVCCLLRESSDPEALPRGDVEIIRGDLARAETYENALASTELLINTTSLSTFDVGRLVEAAENAAVQRAIFLSTTAIFTTLDPDVKCRQLAAESTIVRSRLDYTILRPTMIYGSARDGNMSRLVRFIDRSPVVPIVGTGEFLQQPVFVDDVASAVADVVGVTATVRRSYEIAGAEPLSFREVIFTIGGLLGKRPVIVGFPLAPVVGVLGASEKLGLRLPLGREQFVRLNEDKIFDYTDASRDFGFAPVRFAEGAARLIESMREGVGSE